MTRSHERLSEERGHGVFSKRPQLSVSRQSLGLSLGHRRLRFSFQINDFKDPEPEDRSHRLAPGCGGGGDVVASLSRVKRYFRRRTSFQRPRPETREALFSASFSCVKWFFLKKNLCLQTALEGRRRRLSKEGRSPCQPGFFSHFAGTEIRRLRAAKNRLESPRGLPLFRPTIRLERGT